MKIWGRLLLVKETIVQLMSTSYSYFKENYKLIAMELGKKQALNTNPKERQQIDFNGNLYWDWNTTMLLVIEEMKETWDFEILRLSKET